VNRHSKLTFIGAETRLLYYTWARFVDPGTADAQPLGELLDLDDAPRYDRLRR
jgi:hypothetical protein